MLCDLFRCDVLRSRFGELVLYFFHLANFDYEVGRMKCLIFCFSEGKEDEDDERPELTSATTEESVAPGKSIILHDLAQISHNQLNCRIHI